MPVVACLLALLAAVGCTPTTAGAGRSLAAQGVSEPVVTPGTLVEIPDSRFSMGCDPAVHPICTPDESPAHEVHLGPFAIEATEVTFGQWRACMDASACAEPTGGIGADTLPVVGVTADQAVAYCAWLGRELPSEAQWERAARGTGKGLYPWGDADPSCAQAASRPCTGGVVTVATHPDGATDEGVHDLIGNVYEWVLDWYDPYYYGTSPVDDPHGGDPGGMRVVRGTDQWSDPGAMRATNRTAAIPDASSVVIGFRCAVDR